MMPYFFIDNNPVVEDGVLKKINIDQVVIIPSYCHTLFGIKTKEDIKNKRFGDGLFYNALANSNVVEMVLSDNNIVKIGEKAFENCHNLSSFQIFEGLKEIGFDAFRACYRLRAINLPTTLEKIGENAFNDIESLIINYDGTIEMWNKIEKGDNFAMKGTLINTLNEQFVL